jgi:MFS family permease
MIWTARSSSPGIWYAHRIIIGIVNAPIESLPEISVADLMFAHERGTWMAAYVLVLFESNFIAPLIAGWLNDAVGWRWTMDFGAIVAAVSFVILFFFMEETMYFRHMTDGAQPASHGGEVTDDNDTPLDSEKPQLPTAVYGDNDDTATEKPAVPRSFANKIMPFRRLPGRPSVKQMFFMMIRPLLIIIKFPCVAWAGFIYGINLSWYQVLNGTASPVLSAPPYEWRSAFIGCIYVGPMVGAVFGCLWAGFAADKLAIYLARRNGGIREPEHRLSPLAIAGIFTAAGLITWVSDKRSAQRGLATILTVYQGVGAGHGIHWAGLAFGLGMLVFGLVVGGSVAIAYAIDCFPQIGGESMASVMVIRNTIGFALSYAITPWYTGMGLQNCFITAGFISVVCMGTFLLFMWKGKSLRRFSAKTYGHYAENSVIGAH